MISDLMNYYSYSFKIHFYFLQKKKTSFELDYADYFELDYIF